MFFADFVKKVNKHIGSEIKKKKKLRIFLVRLHRVNMQQQTIFPFCSLFKAAAFNAIQCILASSRFKDYSSTNKSSLCTTNLPGFMTSEVDIENPH